MKFIISLSTIALLIVGCNKLEGQLNVTTDFKLKSSKGDMNTISVGTHNADLDKKSLSKKIVLRLNNNSDEKYEFKIPDGAKIPSNGNFSLKSSEIGQAVDLNGAVDTQVTRSQTRDEFQSCTYTEPYTVCSPSGPNGQTVCQTYMRTVNGSQWVRYYDEYIDQKISMSITPVGSTTSAGEFIGTASNVQRVVVSQTGCR
jgi:PBP1b-binding outer membrane lipoprotein LpoB